MLPLPYVASDPKAQGNFDALAAQFPLSRKSLAVETPHDIGGAGEPAFQNSWANFGGGWQEARFWKTPDGMVHIEGLVAGGTVPTSVVFTLPAGYRPGANLIFATDTNLETHARLDIESDGEVRVRAANATYVSLNCSFKQEA
jgi:hypothetical protein